MQEVQHVAQEAGMPAGADLSQQAALGPPHQALPVLQQAISHAEHRSRQQEQAKESSQANGCDSSALVGGVRAAETAT